MHAAAGYSPAVAQSWSFDVSPGTPPSEQTRSHDRSRSGVGSQVAAPPSTSGASLPPVPQAAVIANTIATRIVRMGEHDAHDLHGAQDRTAGVTHV